MSPNSLTERCSAVYFAKVVPDLDGSQRVFVVALGFHNTGGYSVIFRQEPIDEYPPVLSLWHTKPTAGSDVITPFTAYQILDFRPGMKEIRVLDAKGTNHIAIEK